MVISSMQGLLLQLGIITGLLLGINPAFGQTGTLGLKDGFISFNTSTFAVQLVKGLLVCSSCAVKLGLVPGLG